MTTKAIISGEVRPDGTDGPWMFEVMWGTKKEAAGSADDYQTCREMAAEAIEEVHRWHTDLAYRKRIAEGSEPPPARMQRK